MTVKQWNVGEILAAADLNAWAVPLAAYKAADEPIIASAGTLQDDNALKLTVAANAVYWLTAVVDYDGGTQGASDLKMGWSVPASTVMDWTFTGTGTSGSASSGSRADQAGTLTAGTNGTGNRRIALLSGTVATSAASGTLQFRWCQNTGSATTTTVHAGSLLAAVRVG